MKKQFLAILIAVLMIAVLLPVMGLADTWNIGAVNATDVTATLSGGTLTISGSGAMKDFGWSGGEPRSPWHDQLGNDISTITSVVIGSGVTNIGNNAFRNFNNLTSVTIPSTVTTIGSSAFNGASSLAGIELPANLTSIGSLAFNGNTSLTSIELPASVTFIGKNSFYGCTSLVDVTLKSANPPTLEASNAFTSCNKDLEFTVPSGKGDTYAAATNWSSYKDQIVEALPLPLSITADDIEGFYNSDAHSIDWEAKSGTDVVDDVTVYVRKEGSSSWTLLDNYFENLVNVSDSGTLELKAEKSGYEEAKGSVKLTVKPRIVVLQAKDGSWTYNGSSRTQTEYFENTDLEKEYSKAYWSLTEAPEASIGFAGGEGVDKVSMTSASTIKDVGTVDNEIDEDKITFSNVNPDNYIFYYEKGTLEVTRAAAEFFQIPKAKDLTYDGTAQALVSAGVASEGGTANYAPGTDNTAAPASGWSTSIPTGTDAGTYYVWYKAVGDKNHTDTAARCITVTVKENPITSISVDKTAVTLEEGETETVTATVQPSNASETVSWGSSDTAVATVDSTGVITAKAAGTAKITVKSASGTVSAEVAVTVTKPVIPNYTVTYEGDNALFSDGNNGPTVSVAEEGETVKFGVSAADGYEIKSVTARDAGGNSVTLSGSGPYTFVMPAKDVTVTVKAEKKAAPTYAIAYDGDNALFSDGNNGPTVSLAEEGETVKFGVSAADGYELKSVTAKDAGGNSVTLSGSGPYTFVMPAKDVTVTATAEKKSEPTPTPPPDIPVEQIVLSSDSLTLKPGESQYIGFTVYPHNATDKTVTWSSDNSDVASVNSSTGKVTTWEEGTANITATASNGVSASVNVIVRDDPSRGPIPYTMIIGENQTILPNQPTAVFSSNAEFGKFVKVLMDFKELDASKYSAKSGSTVITLKANYIKTLSAGTHTLRIVSTDGYAETKFTVKDLPKTGDSSPILCWTVGLVLALGGIAAITRKKKTSK